MQHALLGIAIALILAIAAALTAPAYIDWNDWRTHFEASATALAGAPVRIRGQIEASVLPTPSFTVRDVEVGDPDKGSGVRLGEVHGVLALGALMRGIVEAEEFILRRPVVRIVVEPGKPVLPAIGSAARATGLIALARVVLDQGSLIIDDRGAGQIITIDQIAGDGEVRAREGPGRFEAQFRHAGERWSMRANAGQFKSDGSGRLRLTLDRAVDGTSFDADGMLALGGPAARFDGKVTAARKKSKSMPWQIATTVKASEQSLALEGFELTLGADAAPTELAGQLLLVPQRGGRIEGSLSARRIDLDTAMGSESVKETPVALAAAREVIGLLGELPLRGRISVSVDALIAGGNSVRELKSQLGLRENALAIESLEAKLPGRATVRATGSQTGRATFAGETIVEAEDATAFVRWAFGAAAASAFEEDSGLRASGKVDWSGGRFAVDGLDFSLGDAKLGGRFSIAAGEGTRRTRVETALTANGADLDLLMPVANWLRTGSETADLVLGLQGRSLKFLGRPLARIDAAVSRTSEAVAIDRLTIEDFDGLTARASGRIAAPIERPSGKIDFNLSTARPDGLAVIASELFGADAARLVRHVAGPGRALKLSGTAMGAGSAAGVEVTAKGSLGDIEASLAANFDLLTDTLSEANIALDTREASRLIALFGMSGGLPAAGQATLEFDFAAPGKGDLPIAARLSVPGAAVNAEGVLRFGAEDRIEPRLDLRIDATDLRLPLAAVAQTGAADAIPAEGTVRLARTADAFVFENISLRVGGTHVKGLFSVSGVEKPALGGKLAIERMELAQLLGLSLGRARDAQNFWPASRLAAGPLSTVTGALDFEIATLGLSGPLPATATKFKLKIGASDVSVEDFTGELAGGKLAGQARFVRGETLAFDGRATLASFDLARVAAPDPAKSAARGRGDLTLSVAGNGATPMALAASLAGQGTIALQGLEIDRMDPSAVAAVFEVPEKNEPKDEASVVAALSPVLARAPLKIGKLDAPVIVAGGVARTGKARTTVSGVQIVADASIDLAKLTFDSAVEMETTPPAGLTVRPGATVRWRGPVTAPERRVEASALATAITLRAMERETQRIEERDRSLPPMPQRSQELTGSNPMASVPSITPPDPAAPPISVTPRVPLPSSRPREADLPQTALPPLPPPTYIRPVPQIYPPRMEN